MPTSSGWTEAFPPFHSAGNLYHVGGYKKYVAQKEQDFLAELAKQKAAASKSPVPLFREGHFLGGPMCEGAGAEANGN